MRHPKIEKIIELATMFELAAKASDNKVIVDMDMSVVPACDDENLCKTTACHAGWFGVLKHPGKYRKARYSAYSNDMARFLGMDSDSELVNWARKYGRIWGNEDGHLMFRGNEAFGASAYENLTLKDISKHWYGVAKRLEKAMPTLTQIEEAAQKIKAIKKEAGKLEKALGLREDDCSFYVPRKNTGHYFQETIDSVDEDEEEELHPW